MESTIESGESKVNLYFIPYFLDWIDIHDIATSPTSCNLIQYRYPILFHKTLILLIFNIIAYPVLHHPHLTYHVQYSFLWLYQNLIETQLSKR